MDSYPRDLVESLAKRVKEMKTSALGNLEKNCWMVVHEHKHGVMPSEYDIREIDETLYLSVLSKARQMNALN